MKKKSNWILAAIIGGVLAVCLIVIGARMAGIGIPGLTPTPEPVGSEEPFEVIGPVALVMSGDTIMDIVDLGTVTETYTKVFESPDGGTNTVEYAPGDIRVVEATCPDHVCMGQGWLIENMGSLADILPISCLPNSLAIWKVPMDDAETPEVDGATQ